MGRHILEHALSGPLGQHRTRILATHHMDLCISAARYHVKLGRGIVKQAVEITASPLTGRVGMGSQPNYLGKITPEVSNENQSHILSGQDSHEECKPDLDAQSKPRAFVEEEVKQLGVVKLAIYWQYVSAAKGWHFWTFLVSLFELFEFLIVGRVCLCSFKK